MKNGLINEVLTHEKGIGKKGTKIYDFKKFWGAYFNLILKPLFKFLNKGSVTLYRNSLWLLFFSTKGLVAMRHTYVEMAQSDKHLGRKTNIEIGIFGVE